MKHTPGTWYASNGNSYQGIVCVEETGETIAVSYDKRNTDLIAAAPDLLEALKIISTGFAKRFGGKAYSVIIPKDGMERIRAAIEKAES